MDACRSMCLPSPWLQQLGAPAGKKKNYIERAMCVPVLTLPRVAACGDKQGPASVDSKRH